MRKRIIKTRISSLTIENKIPRIYPPWFHYFYKEQHRIMIIFNDVDSWEDICFVTKQDYKDFKKYKENFFDKDFMRLKKLEMV